MRPGNRNRKRLTQLRISLGAAIGVYIVIGVKKYRDKKSKGADE